VKGRSLLAVYHLRLKVHSRALGRTAREGGATRRSAIAAAAYRSGERLYDESQGKWFAFDKPDVVHTEILAPGADAPAWVFDREALWNAVEKAEKRQDAQLCREIELTLPRELTPEARIDLVREFVRDQFVSRGMVADIAVHNPDAADGREQPHAHVLLTLRHLDPSTATGFASTKDRDWNEPESIMRLVAEARKRLNNTGLPEDKDALHAAEAQRNVNVWRRVWAEYANRALADAGSSARIDHRTLEAQGIFRIPQITLGIARHIDRAYSYVRERVTQWVSIKKRADLLKEAEHYQQRDPEKLADFITRLSEMAESFADQFKRTPQMPEADYDR
jgi:ATP-dependent exoDNAse (exonuclease V) alpha subunit